MASIPRRTITATLRIVSDDREVELVERSHVPALFTDTDVIELGALGRLVQSAAGRYGSRLSELLAPLRAAAAGGELDDDADDEPVAGPSTLERACMMWRHAALCLLESYLTGQPLDFGGEAVPDVISSRLEAAFAEQQRDREQRQPVEPQYVPADYRPPGGPGSDPGEAATELLPAHRAADETAVMPAVQSQRFRHPGEVPIEVGALRYVDNVTGGADVWFVHEHGLDWVSSGPDGDGNRFTLHALFKNGEMIEVDRATGRPA